MESRLLSCWFAGVSSKDLSASLSQWGKRGFVRTEKCLISAYLIRICKQWLASYGIWCYFLPVLLTLLAYLFCSSHPYIHCMQSGMNENLYFSWNPLTSPWEGWHNYIHMNEHDTVKVHCFVLELMSRQILEQITAEEIIQYKTFRSEDLHQLYKT